MPNVVGGKNRLRKSRRGEGENQQKAEKIPVHRKKIAENANGLD